MARKRRRTHADFVTEVTELSGQSDFLSERESVKAKEM